MHGKGLFLTVQPPVVFRPECESLLLIDLACCHEISDLFQGIFERHHKVVSAVVEAVHPEEIMMLVTALVVHEGIGIAFPVLCRIDRRSVPCIVCHAFEEFNG